MEPRSVRLILELPGELVVMEVPEVEAERRFLALDAVQFPFPPPHGAGGIGMTNPYKCRRERIDPTKSYEPTQLPFPPPYDQ